jgi:hypothetical protein
VGHGALVESLTNLAALVNRSAVRVAGSRAWRARGDTVDDHSVFEVIKGLTAKAAPPIPTIRRDRPVADGCRIILPDTFPSGRFLRCLIEDVGQLGITW